MNTKMKRVKRRILLIIDNCPAHPAITGLDFVILKFLPPNTTAMTQPMDQGIIWSLKSHYKKMLMERSINSMDSGEPFQFSLLDALFMVRTAWNQVTEETIARCFAKAGFDITTPGEDKENSLEVDELIPLMQQLQVPDDVSTAAYVNADDGVATCEQTTDEDIVTSILNPGSVDDCESEDTSEDEAEEPDREEAVSSLSGALSGLSQLRSFLQHSSEDQKVHQSLQVLEKALVDVKLGRLRQTQMTDFFDIQP